MSTSHRAFHPGEFDLEELPGYQPLSVSAIVGLVLGLISFTALFHPVLWLVPVLGVVVNLYALSSMDDSRPAVGRKSAMIGLVLSLLLGAAAPARIYSYEYF